MLLDPTFPDLDIDDTIIIEACPTSLAVFDKLEKDVGFKGGARFDEDIMVLDVGVLLNAKLNPVLMR